MRAHDYAHALARQIGVERTKIVAAVHMGKNLFAMSGGSGLATTVCYNFHLA